MLEKNTDKTQKLFLTFILFSIVLSFLTIGIEKTFFSDNTQKIAIANSIKKAQEREIIFKDFLTNSEHSLKYLRELNLFKDYINNAQNSENITQLFYSYTKINPQFKQLRYIDKLGIEKIAIKRGVEFFDPYIVDKINLQDESDDYYFKHFENASKESVWFSAIDLEKENQEFLEQKEEELRTEHTLRAILPIMVNKNFQGILVIDYFMDSFLEKLANTPLYDMSLINDKGDFIIHYDSDDKNTNHSLSKEFPNHFKKILDNQSYQTDMFISKRLELPINGGLKIILQLKKEYIHKLKSSNINRHLTLSIIILFSALLLSLFIIKFFSNTILDYEEIVKLNQNLSNASKIAKIGFWEYDAKIDKIYWNGGAFNIYEVDEYNGVMDKEFTFSFFLDKDRAEIEKLYEKSILKKEPLFLSKKIKTKKGNIKSVEIRSEHYYDKKGNYLKSIGSILDITEKKKNDEKINEAFDLIKKEKYRYEKLLESAPDAVMIMNNEGKIVDYNSAAKKLFGYNDIEMVNLRVTDWDEAYSLEEIEEIFTNTKENETLNFEAIHKKKDGTTFNASVSSIKIKIHEREFFFSTVRDITIQKNLEKNLEEQKEKFETIYNYSKDGIAIVDLESNFLEFNNAYLEMTEYSKEELLTKSCNILTAPEEREKGKKALEQALEEGFLTNFEKTCITKSGKRIKINMSASLLPNKETFLIVAKDMTLLKLLDEQSKLAAMGEMIGNIAHQWRQPLSVVSTSASSIKFKIEFDDEPDKEFITYSSDMIVEQVNYLSKTIDDFRNFIKGDTSIKETSILDVLNSTFTLVDATITNNYIHLIKDIEDDLIILGNKNELQQAIINIINNAKDAIKESVKDDENKLLFISTKKVDNDTLELKILDSGGGIKKEAIDRLFEPYFTTKDENTGTGIGLAMVDKIIRERHNAQIKVSNETFTYENKEFKGACFSLLFKSSTKIELF